MPFFDFSKMTVFTVQIPLSTYFTLVAPQATDPVRLLLQLLSTGEYSSGEMREKLGVTHRANFRDNYIRPAISLGLIVQTTPHKPTASYSVIV